MIPREVNTGDNYMCLTVYMHLQKCSQKAEGSILKDEGFLSGKYFA